MSLPIADGPEPNTVNSEEEKHDNNSPGLMWRMLLGTIRKGFPDVKQLRTDQLAKWIDNKSMMKNILLLDIRETDEFAVGTIDGAININPDASNRDFLFEKIYEKNDDLPQVKTVVCFCSVGYRSAKMTQILQNEQQNEEEGGKYTVFNLEGSLFKWANEERAMVDKFGNKTIFCHPYNAIWGKFLNSNLRKYTV